MQTNVCTKNAVKKIAKKEQMFKLRGFKCLNTNEEFYEPQKVVEALNDGLEVVASGALENYNGKRNVSVTTAPILKIDIFKKCLKFETGRFIYKVKM